MGHAPGRSGEKQAIVPSWGRANGIEQRILPTPTAQLSFRQYAPWNTKTYR